MLNSTGSVESQGVRNVVQSSFAEIQPASSLERNGSRKTWRYCGFDCDSTTEQVQLQVGILKNIYCHSKHVVSRLAQKYHRLIQWLTFVNPKLVPIGGFTDLIVYVSFDLNKR